MDVMIRIREGDSAAHNLGAWLRAINPKKRKQVVAEIYKMLEELPMDDPAWHPAWEVVSVEPPGVNGRT